MNLNSKDELFKQRSVSFDGWIHFRETGVRMCLANSFCETALQ